LQVSSFAATQKAANCRSRLPDSCNLTSWLLLAKVPIIDFDVTVSTDFSPIAWHLYKAAQSHRRGVNYSRTMDYFPTHSNMHYLSNNALQSLLGPVIGCPFAPYCAHSSRPNGRDSCALPIIPLGFHQTVVISHQPSLEPNALG
jgi:hypothetical protein